MICQEVANMSQEYFVHESSYIDDNVKIGSNSIPEVIKDTE